MIAEKSEGELALESLFSDMITKESMLESIKSIPIDMPIGFSEMGVRSQYFIIGAEVIRGVHHQLATRAKVAGVPQNKLEDPALTFPITVIGMNYLVTKEKEILGFVIDNLYNNAH